MRPLPAHKGHFMIHYAETAYGFEYGSVEVKRVCSDDKKGWVMLRLITPRHPSGLQVYVTKTGKVRVYSGGGEWTPPDKEKNDDEN